MVNKTNAQARQGTATPTTISIPQLRNDFRGAVIGPQDAEYDRARTVFYGGIDRRPAVIIKPVDVEEVARIVSLARETGMELAVRAARTAGHSVSEGDRSRSLGIKTCRSTKDARLGQKQA
jgi:hypothetical protein